MDRDLVYCDNIQELMEEMQLDHTSGQWRHFTDWSKVSLKAVLLYNRNEFPSIPVAHGSSHDRNVQEPSGFAAKKICYEEHR